MEAQLLAGHPDIEGLCLALADWSGELRQLQASPGLAAVAPRLAHVRSGGDGLAYGPRRYRIDVGDLVPLLVRSNSGIVSGRDG